MAQLNGADDAAPVTWGEFRDGAERVLALSVKIQLYTLNRSEEALAEMNEAAAQVNAFFGATMVKAAG